MWDKAQQEELRRYLKSLPQLARGDKAPRVAKAKRNFWYFIRTYMAHHIDEAMEESSAFRRFVHQDLDRLAKKHKKIELEAYRGAAKSTVIARLYILWKIAKGETRFTVLLSDTIEVAKGNLEFIKTEIEENKSYAYDFEIAAGFKWAEEEVIIKAPVGLVKIKCYGAGKRIRGANFLSFRPDLIILDDIENDENVESKRQRDKLYNWFKKAILKLPARKKPYILIVIGTILHHDSVLSRISKRKDFYHRSFPLVISFPRNREAWEQLYTLSPDEARRRYEARKRYYDYGAQLDDEEIDLFEVMMEYFEDIDAFMSELQNTPITQEKLIFGGYTEYSEMPKCDAYSIAIDPSLGKSKKGDYFGIGYLGYHKESKKLYARIKGYKIPAIDMIPKIIELYLELKRTGKPVTLAIETVAFQEFYKDTIKLFARSHDIHIPVITYNNTAPKELRIEAIAPLVRDGTIPIHQHDYLLKEELDTYPKAAHDDLLDTLEMAYRSFSGVSVADYRAIRRAVENNRYKFLHSRSRYA